MLFFIVLCSGKEQTAQAPVQMGIAFQPLFKSHVHNG